MNESLIKEIKALYSSRAKENKSPLALPEIQQKELRVKPKNTFFNGVLEKLNNANKS